MKVNCRLAVLAVLILLSAAASGKDDVTPIDLDLKPIELGIRQNVGKTMASDTPLDEVVQEQFLKVIYQLALELPLSVEKISKTFAWPVTERVLRVNGNDKSAVFIFTLHNNLYKVHYFDGDVTGNLNLTIPLHQAENCIRSEKVLEIFGQKFKPMPVIYHPFPNSERVTEIVKKNRALFMAGPIYEMVQRQINLRARIGFTFHFSECAHSVYLEQSIFQRSHYDEK